MKITTTKDKVTIDGNGSLLLTTNSRGFDISGMSDEGNIPLDIRYFHIVSSYYGRELALKEVTNYLGYGRVRKFLINLIG